MALLWQACLYVCPKPVQSIRFGGYHPKKVVMYKNFLKGTISELRPVQLIAEPVRVDMVFVFPLRQKDKDVWRWHVERTDIVNLRKPVEDAMNAVVLKDDALICAGDTYKIRKDNDGEIHIRVFSISAGDYHRCEDLQVATNENRGKPRLA